MLQLNLTLKRTEQPALEQRSDVVDAWHDLVGGFFSVANVRDAVFVTGGRKVGITSPSIGMNGSPRFHSLSDEGQQAFGEGILDAFQPYTPDPASVLFCGDHLFLYSTPPPAVTATGIAPAFSMKQS